MNTSEIPSESEERHPSGFDNSDCSIAWELATRFVAVARSSGKVQNARPASFYAIAFPLAAPGSVMPIPNKDTFWGQGIVLDT